MLGVTLAENYVIDECVGEGAMGRVYRAHNARLARRQFAVKILLGDLAAEPTMRQRFAREAEAASRLDHPNVVSVIDFGETPEGLLYIVMEFVRGQSLADLIDNEGPLPEERVVDITRQLCLGLAHAHEQGLVHRDFKPDNVAFFESDGGIRPRILDFGLAIVADDGKQSTRLTQAGLVVGTPAYTAPEQARGQELDERVDLFALGITIYEMLTGVTPFNGSVIEVLRANIDDEPPPVGERARGARVSAGFDGVMRKLLAKERDQRFESARAVIEAIDGLDAGATAALGADADADADADVDVDAPADADAMLAVSDTMLAIDTQSDTMLAVGAQPADKSSGAAAPTAGSGLQRAALVVAFLGILALGVLGYAWFSGNEPPTSRRPPTAQQPAPARGATPVDNDASSTAAEPPPEQPPTALAAPYPDAAPQFSASTPRSRRPRDDQRRPRPTEPTAPVVTDPQPAIEPATTTDAAIAAPIPTPLPRADPPPPPVLDPPTKPIGPLDATVSIEKLKVTGPLSPREPKRAVERARSALRSCYKSAATRAQKKPAATVTVDMVIAESGRARDVRVGDAPLPNLSSCVDKAVSGVRSLDAPDVGTAKVSFVIRFSPVKP